MANTTTNSPSSIVDNNAVGTVAWNNPSNAGADDSSYAISASILTDAATVIEDNIVSIVKADGTVGSKDLSRHTSWSTTEAYTTYGSDSELWGETWTAEQINDSDFGVVISAKGTANTHYLKATGFGFSVPTGATIDGIKVEIKKVIATSCFCFGTKINTLEGTVDIEDISVGDKILSLNNDGKVVLGEVSGVMRYEDEERTIYNIYREGSKRPIRATGNHRIFANGEYKLAEKVATGDILLDRFGHGRRVLKVVPSESFEPVIDLSMKDSPTFFAEGVAVHNFSPPKYYAKVNHIRMTVYYTESSGTDASSERGLYTKGKNTGSSERGLYTKGYLTSNSERGMYLEGYVSSLYSKESSASLKTNDTNLANAFTQQEYTDVATDNDTYVDLIGTYEYFQFLFKEPNDNSTDDFRITWKGKSTVAPSSYPVYLQIYNRTTSSWTNLTSNSTASANTKFTLTYDVTTGMSDYYDANHVISARVYQDVVV